MNLYIFCSSFVVDPYILRRGLDVMGAAVIGLDVVGLDVVGLNVVGLNVVGAAVVGLNVGFFVPPLTDGAQVGIRVGVCVGVAAAVSVNTGVIPTTVFLGEWPAISVTVVPAGTLLTVKEKSETSWYMRT